MPATDAQVQTFVDTRLRPCAEQIRNLDANITDILSQINDVYQACVSPGGPRTWVDSRTDVPHKMTCDDVINLNGILSRLKTAIEGDGQWPVCENCCVRPILG